jgi:two-component system sensor histidine kinase/response regulator
MFFHQAGCCPVDREPHMTDKKPLILIIDDEESMRDSCSLILVKDGYRAETAENGQIGLEKIKALQPHLALIDLKMPGLNGFEVLEQALAFDPSLIPVVITGYATVDSAVEAMKRGAYDFLPKPFTPEELRIIIRRGLERRRLRLEAEALRREKKLMEENFITMVSHQLRSPLVAVQQYFEVILAGLIAPLDDRLKEMLGRAHERMASLLQLINDWLDLSRLSHGQIVDKIRPISLQPLLHKLVDFLQPAAAEDKVTLHLEEAEGSDLVPGDEQSLEQVFSNLLSNGVKYNRPGGSVLIRVKEEKETVAVEVKDTGIGIAAEHLPHIFDQFYRIKRSENQKAKGTGLGLAIAKKIVEAHNGYIRVSSEPGQGTTFTVVLPKGQDH